MAFAKRLRFAQTYRIVYRHSLLLYNFKVCHPRCVCNSLGGRILLPPNSCCTVQNAVAQICLTVYRALYCIFWRRGHQLYTCVYLKFFHSFFYCFHNYLIHCVPYQNHGYRSGLSFCWTFMASVKTVWPLKINAYTT